MRKQLQIIAGDLAVWSVVCFVISIALEAKWPGMIGNIININYFLIVCLLSAGISALLKKI